MDMMIDTIVGELMDAPRTAANVGVLFDLDELPIAQNADIYAADAAENLYSRPA